MGRAIQRIVSCYEPLSSITVEADRCVIAEAEDSSDLLPITNEEVEVARARDRTFTAYELLIEVSPQILDLMKSPNSDKFKAHINRLQEGANGARIDDNSRLKWEVANWINEAYHLEPDVRLSIKDRDNRGFQHDTCGELLTSIEVDWSDITVRESIRSGRRRNFNINSSYFLRCLYPDGKGDPNEVEKDFLRSRWLLLAFHAIFISPSIEENEYQDEEPRSPPRKKQKKSEIARSNVATILNMNGKVTCRSIAYTAVLLVFNLHDATSWREKHNGFSFHGFYNFLVDYLEDTPDSYSKAYTDSLLDWWNCRVFPHHVASVSDSRASHKKVAAQRAAAARCS